MTHAYPTNPSFVRRGLMATGQFERVKVSSVDGRAFVKRPGGKMEFYGTTEDILAAWHAERRAKYGGDAAELFKMAGI